MIESPINHHQNTDPEISQDDLNSAQFEVLNEMDARLAAWVMLEAISLNELARLRARARQAKNNSLTRSIQS